MKIWIMSDLHTEFWPHNVPEPDYDVAILAGDIGVGTEGIKWANFYLTKKPVLYVLGNHECYRQRSVEYTVAACKEAANPNVKVLDNEEYTIDGQHFFGATMWTDFKLDGNKKSAMDFARTGMSDFWLIGRAGDKPHKILTPEDTAQMHSTTRMRMVSCVKPETVVITHHGPHPLSVHPKYAGSQLNPAFNSNLEKVITSLRPKLWVHGHVHDCFDYQVGDTRVIANPKAYPRENPTFQFDLVVEV